jgi:hypothetical protein
MFQLLRKSIRLLLVALILGGHALAQSPDADIEAVQRKLEAAKQAQAAKDAAASREADQRAAREASAAAAQANLGTLIVQTDHACGLSIDGIFRQEIGPGETASLKVEPGDQLIECVSRRFEGLKVQEVKPLASSSKSVVVLAFGGRVATAEIAEREAQRFQQWSDGVYDSKQNVIWASSDNGSEISSVDAPSYCAGKGGSWTLPTLPQLLSLKQRLGPMRYTGNRYWPAPSGQDVFDFFGVCMEANDCGKVWKWRALCVLPSKEAIARRFQKQADGVYDRERAVTWAFTDNGKDISWNDAQSYCASKGTGWSLPSVAQLQELYDSSGALTQPCFPGNDPTVPELAREWICKVTPLIGLSGPAAWSSEPNGSSEAWGVFFVIGERISGSVDDTDNARALCVRRS